MEITQGLIYNIIKMPASISYLMVDDILQDFECDYLLNFSGSEMVLDMSNQRQLIKSSLKYIEGLINIINKNSGKLYIINVSETVLSVLNHHLSNKSVAIFKDRLDFENEIGPLLTDDLPAAEETHDDRAKSIKKSMSIMIVEPSIPIRNNQKEILEKIGLKDINLAKDRVEAEKKIRNTSGKIDLFLLNIASGKSEIDLFVKNIRGNINSKEAKIIVTHPVSVSSQVLEELSGADVDGVIQSTPKPEELQDMLKNILSK